MRLATRIIRTPFSLSHAQMSRTYPGDKWEELKDEQGAKHRGVVADQIRALPGPLLGVNSGYRADGPPSYDGRIAEWWSVISYDGPPDDGR